jgi:hypothetical protein
MTYCIDFFRKFKKEGNFCGLDKTQVSRLTAYLEIVELLMKQKIPEEQIYENFSVNAATPLMAAKGEAHTEGLNFVTRSLKEGKKVTNGDVQTTLKSCSTTTRPTAKEPLPVEKKSETPVKFGIKVCRERKCVELRKNENEAYPEDSQERCQVFNTMPGTLPCCIKDPAIPPEELLHHALWNLHTDWEKNLKINRKTPGPKNCPSTCPYKISEQGEVFGKTGAGRYEKKQGTIWKCAFVGAVLGSGLAGSCPCHVLDNPQQEKQIDLLKEITGYRKGKNWICDCGPCPDGCKRTTAGDKTCPVIRVDFDDLKECPLWRIPAKILPAIAPASKKEPIVLHPEIKKQDPSKCFSPQPGSIPVTTLHPQLSLGQQLATKEVPAVTIPEAPIAQVLKEKYNGNVSKEIPPARKPACLTLEYEICPDLEHHIKSDKNRGKICDVIGIPLNQLPHNECPLDRELRLKGTLPDRLKPASDLVDPHTGGRIIKPAPYKLSKSRLSDGERDGMVDALIEHTAFTPKDIEQIDELVKGNREGWECRFDLVEAAVMMLLAKAEGA